MISAAGFKRAVEQAREKSLTLPRQVVFGEGAIAELPPLLQALEISARVFLVFGGSHAADTGVQSRIETSLATAGFVVAGQFQTRGEPTTEMVDSAANICRAAQAGLIVACGGGSVIDCGKAVAAMATNPGSVRAYLEGVGKEKLSTPPLPVVAVPTTAGTGSEGTRNAVLSVPDLGIKRSLRHPDLVPAIAILDPQLTWTSPPAVTAASGMDALTQLIESVTSIKRRRETTDLALLGLAPIRKALPACYRNPHAGDERAAMSMSAFLSGVCLANAGLGLVHGIASGLGALKDLPHGFICAVLLPHALRYNREAAVPELRASLAAFLNEAETGGTIEQGIGAIDDLKKTLDLPSDLRFLGLSDEEVREVAARSMGSSMSGNPVPMTPEAVADFLRPLAC